MHQSVIEIIKYLKELKCDPRFISNFKSEHKGLSRFELSKFHEQLIVDYSNNLLDRLSPTYKNNIFDSELDLKFGDFMDIYGNYYDLKVGEGGVNNYCGSIGVKSLLNFGNTNTNLHYYICANRDFSSVYIINARVLYKEYMSGKYSKYKVYLGEMAYKDSSSVIARI